MWADANNTQRKIRHASPVLPLGNSACGMSIFPSLFACSCLWSSPKPGVSPPSVCLPVLCRRQRWRSSVVSIVTRLHRSVPLLHPVSRRSGHGVVTRSHRGRTSTTAPDAGPWRQSPLPVAHGPRSIQAGGGSALRPLQGGATSPVPPREMAWASAPIRPGGYQPRQCSPHPRGGRRPGRPTAE